MSIKVSAIILTAGIALMALLYILPLIVTPLYWFVVVLLFVVTALTVTYGTIALLVAFEKYMSIRADRVAKQYHARVISTAHGTWFVAHKHIDIAPLSNTPYLRINGHERELTPDERLYATLQAPHNRASGAMGLLPTPQPTNEQQLDLLSIFTQSTQSYAIIGGQQVGKTFQARRIAQYWLQSGIKPIVIGPKWDKDEWDGCTMFGGGYNFERVSQGMRIARKLAEDRHGNGKMGHKEHAIQPVFFDDWTAIRAKLEKEAEDFIIDATTLYASVNIILYFIIHLDTANAWGVGRVGAALHQNFIKLFIEPGFNNGMVDRSKNIGWLLYPGQSKKDRQRVSLFNGTGQQILIPDLIQQLTLEESKVSEMLAAGASRSAIARSVFGDDGGNQLKRVDKIIEKLNP